MPHATAAALLDRIDALLDGSQEPAQMERTLTDGYACALTLETERLRIKRTLNGGSSRTPADQALQARLVAIDSELQRLRTRLAVLRAKFDQA